MSGSGIVATIDTPRNQDDRVTSPSDHGSLDFSSNGLTYVDSGHWAAVLDGIAELKDHVGQHFEANHIGDDQDLSQPDQRGPLLLYGGVRETTKEEILASVQSRPVVDRLVYRFFNSLHMSPGQISMPLPTHCRQQLDSLFT